MLSHHEDRELRAIEQWFEESDPALTRMLRNYEAPGRTVLRTVLRVAVIPQRSICTSSGSNGRCGFPPIRRKTAIGSQG